jgi:hypothetical protein
MNALVLQVMIHIIDLQNPSKTEKRPITADAAIMNPVAKIRKFLPVLCKCS